MTDLDSASLTAMTVRRRAVWVGVASAAALAGVGLAWWRSQPQQREAASDSPLWRHTFERPNGGELVMRSLRGRPLLVNFWATWCPPCVQELPLLDRFYREQADAGWQVVGLAIDQPAAVRGFLQRSPLSFPVGLAGLDGTELSRALGNRQGGLPFTVVLGPGGDVLHRKMGQLTPQDLQAWTTLKKA